MCVCDPLLCYRFIWWRNSVLFYFQVRYLVVYHSSINKKPVISDLHFNGNTENQFVCFAPPTTFQTRARATCGEFNNWIAENHTARVARFSQQNPHNCYHSIGKVTYFAGKPRTWQHCTHQRRFVPEWIIERINEWFSESLTRTSQMCRHLLAWRCSL